MADQGVDDEAAVEANDAGGFLMVGLDDPDDASASTLLVDPGADGVGEPTGTLPGSAAFDAGF